MGRSPCCSDKEGLKKGPWTQEEDQKLITFVTEHGHGNWRSLPKNCGLLRCGKSCRLRWTNYLRPDIKRGLFTANEEQTILQLHALVGNKWAFIASQLPKRTDNEIKNYWNTVLRKRLGRVGLAPFGTMNRTSSTLTPVATERRNGEEKSICKSGALSKKPSGSIIFSPVTSMNCTHLAQWESARLEAEARLAKESVSKKTHKLTPFQYMGLSFPSNLSTATTTITPPPTTTASAIAAFPFLSRNDSSTTTTASAFPSFPITNSTACLPALTSFPIATTALSLFPSLSDGLQQTLQQELASCLLNPLKSMSSTTSEPCSLLHHTSTNNCISPTPSLSLPANNCLSQASSLRLPSSLYPSTTSPITSASSLSSFSLPISSLCTATSSLILPTSSHSNTSSLFSPISPLSASTSTMSLPDIVHMPSSSSVSDNSSNSPKSMSSKASAELSSQKSIPSVPSLGSRLSWQAISGTSQAPFLSQMLCKNVDEHCIQAVKFLSVSESRGDPGFRDTNAQRADPTSSSMSNSMVNSLDSWHDLLFDVENSCASDVVSTNWKYPAAGISSDQREEMTQDAETSNGSKSGCNSESLRGTVQAKQGNMDFGGLTLLQFDSLTSCEQYSSQNSKELLGKLPLPCQT